MQEGLAASMINARRLVKLQIGKLLLKSLVNVI
jgi:hypothetical protein